MARFPRRARVRRAADFKAILKEGRRVSSRFFTAVVRASELDSARLGLAIAARIAPRAIDRNRIKRQIRESFRANVAALPAVDVVVMGRPQCAAAAAALLAADLLGLWPRIGQACKPS